MELNFKISKLHRPQGYFYKDGNRWVKFFIAYVDGIKWNLFCRSLGHEPSKQDLDTFVEQTGVVIKDNNKYKN